MLIPDNTQLWAARGEDGVFIDYVVAHSTEEAASLVYHQLGLEKTSYTALNPFDGTELTD